MATEFQMPKLGLTMEAGTIIGWHVPDGAEVTKGTPVLAIETDKVESDVEASASGRLHQIGAPGETFGCGARIGWFLAEGEEPPAGGARPPAAATGSEAAAAPAASAVAAVAGGPVRGAGGRILSSPNARRVAAELGIDIAAVSGSGPGGRIVSEDVQRHAEARPAPVPDLGVPLMTTVAARRLADLLGVDIAAVPRTGADPRVTRDDVASHVRQQLAGAGPAPASTPPGQAPERRRSGRRARPSGSGTALPPPSQTPMGVVPMRGMRRTIASRMHDSLHNMAQLTLTMDAAMDRIVADRRRRQVDGAAPSYTDYVIAAVAAALVEHPVVNSQITDDGIALLPEVNVGMAVALDDGLVVPVVRGADRRSITDISVETERLAAAARSRSLGLDDFQGATFTVTAMGMYGVDAFTPIINPPNTAILGVGRIRRDVHWDDDDQPVPRSTLTLSLTWDHRAFDGAPAAEFTGTVREVLESWGLE
ncbi:MAG: 2-oxo acid dehydrogenase subunit E2 [Acidimicrobiaceae bacterium]|nr:2-oxo acid dehydrogenase subunit E2 [Acidimicrobiaceae bacterium]MYL03354.1 2-oxo acid dehydrogenase subunit E2 [Acidimicrobiaceae bacterium]